MPTYKVTNKDNNILNVKINYSEQEVNQILEDAQIYLFKFQNRLCKSDNFDSELLRFVQNEDVLDELDIYWTCHNELRNLNRNEADVKNNQFFKVYALEQLDRLVHEMNLFGCNENQS